MKRFAFSFLILALGAFAGLPEISAQTIPHVTGTFKTPANQTPAQAGLKVVATIGSTAVYGSVEFQPYDSAGNKPTRILCGGITYIPQRVRAWIKGDGTLVDNATAAAGVDLVPTAGCTPTGLVVRAFMTLGGTADGRIPSVSWTEDKSVPQQASADWGALSVAAIASPAFNYQLQSGGGINDYEEWTAASAPANPAAGKARTWFDTTALLWKCKKSDGTDCNPAGGGGAVTSVFGRTGAVAAQTGDYTAAQVTNAFDITAANPLTNVAAPATPAAGKTSVYVDSIQKVLSAKDDAGAVSITVKPDAGAANNFLTAIGANGAISKAQPGFGNLSGSIAIGQTPLTTEGDLLFANFTPALARLPRGTNGQCLTSTLTTIAWGSCAGGGSNHNLLSATHPDTTPAAVLRGAIVTGQGATPTWSLLALGLANRFLRSDGTDAAWSQVNLATNDVTGILPIASGGLNNSAAPSADGQIPIWDQTQAKYVPGDPIISLNYANLLNAAAATATASSASPVRLSTFSNYGTLFFTFAGITGAPAGCTVQIKNADSLGNLLNNGSAVTVTPANGTTSAAFTPAAALPTGAKMSATYACTTYPTAGMISVDFVPAMSVGIINAAANPVRTDPTGTTTQPISAASLPLPTGAATETTLAALNTKIPASPATDRTTAAGPAAVRLSDGAAFYKGTTPADTQPVSAASLPLPTGAATEATLAALNTKINTEITADYDTGAGVQTMKMAGLALPASGGAVAGGTATNPLRTDPTGTTAQPVSQSTAAALSGAWPVKLTDGTNTAPTMDAAARAGFQKTTDGTNVLVVDPCQNSANTRTPFNISLTASGQIIAGTASKQTYICSLFLVTGTAQNIALVEGTGTTCATGIAGMAGGTTSATGQNWAANGGFFAAATGYWHFKTATAADNVCLLLSGTGQTSGNGTYVQQ